MDQVISKIKLIFINNYLLITDKRNHFLVYLKFLIGFVLAMGSQCYRSKCSKVEFCCIKIIRDTNGEEDLDRQSPISPIQSSISNGRL